MLVCLQVEDYNPYLFYGPLFYSLENLTEVKKIKTVLRTKLPGALVSNVPKSKNFLVEDKEFDKENNYNARLALFNEDGILIW